MTKKTFNIATLFNHPTQVEKSLDQVLADTVAEQALDQQDIIDILETAARNHSAHMAYYMGVKENYVPFPGQPYSFQSRGREPGRFPFGNTGFEFNSPNPYGSPFNVFTGDQHPEFFEKVFETLEFEIHYGNTTLTRNFKFAGIEIDKGLTYLGRDKELATVEGAVTFSQGVVHVHLHVQRSLSHIRVMVTPESRELLTQMMQRGEFVTPGNKPFSASTRDLIQHLRQQQWRQVSEGDLVTVLDRPEVPETVFMVGRIDHEGESHGGMAEAVVMPVQILMDNKEVTAKPLGGGIQKVDLMLLKPWNPKD